MSSFKLNLRGPSFTIQSACSVLGSDPPGLPELKIQRVRHDVGGGGGGACAASAGILGGKANLYSLDGHCRPFDSHGQGTIFGSGVGAVLLKRLQKAVADRDHIFAVIKGTAANNDGSAKISYTKSASTIAGDC